MATSLMHPVTETLLPVYKRSPMELVRGQGVFLYDADGKSYLDFTSGIAVNALGYGDVGLRAAMEQAAEGLVHVSNLFRSAPGEQLADRLTALSFADRVFFCNSGAEANEGAFKIARRWARSLGGSAKHEIVGLRGGFHGRLFASLAATDRPSYRAPFRPLAGGITIAERDINDLATLLQADTVAAVVVEPIQGEGGVRVLDPAFLRELRALTTERQIALIFDEIQCGLGRTGKLFAYEHLEITPDVMTLAKPLAGGLPMGAVLMTDELSRTMQPGDHGSTFGGGPFVAAVALHVIERLANPELLTHVADVGLWFGDMLHALQARSPRVRAVRGKGLMWGLDISVPAAEVVVRSREGGLLILTAGEHTLRMLPPLVINREELASGLEILEGAIG